MYMGLGNEQSMCEVMAARNVTLSELETYFQLQATSDPAFFPEWQHDLPLLSEQEKQSLDKLQTGYLHLIKYSPVLENTVQVAIVAPLLFLADLYLPPFRMTSEETMRISAVDDSVVIEGKIDVLVLREQLWVMAIESKGAAFSVEVGLPQLLSYMLANPYPAALNIGLITTGGSFLFVKMAGESLPRYGVSQVFEMRNPGNDLYDVLRVLKRLRQVFAQ
jgi:hypothetical protein